MDNVIQLPGTTLNEVPLSIAEDLEVIPMLTSIIEESNLTSCLVIGENEEGFNVFSSKSDLAEALALLKRAERRIVEWLG